MSRFLVIEGNTSTSRTQQVAAGGIVPSEGYAGLIRALQPGAVVDRCYPADGDAGLPSNGALDGYDGVAITGSSLHAYDATPAVTRQIDLVRAVLARGIPVFGSCWGLQILTVAAGGSVRKNPRGREIGVCDISLTEAGSRHPMFKDKASKFEALTIHLDEVASLAPDMTVLASNAVSQVQAAEIRHPAGIAWGVQYHPEYTLGELAAIIRRASGRLIEEGIFLDKGALASYASDLDTLGRDASDRAMSRRYNINGAVLDKTVRSREISNWIAHQVLPARNARGRG